MSLGSYRSVSSLGSLEPGSHLCGFPPGRGPADSDRSHVHRPALAVAYGTRRPHDLGTVADGFRSAAEQSRKRGFPGLRVAAQMDALAPLLGSAEEVIRWERRSTDLRLGIGVSPVCLHDAGRLDHHLAALLVYEHAGVAPEVDGTALASFVAVDELWGLRVFGEVDISNRGVLHRALLSRAAVQPRIHLDLEGLRLEP